LLPALVLNLTIILSGSNFSDAQAIGELPSKKKCLTEEIYHCPFF
jgi:hypothetical protein